MRVTAKHLRIHGRVQGVFYRGWMVEAARGLGVSGWVRNRADGTVEALIAGEQADLLLDLCRDGPPAARVDRIDVTESEEAAPPDFEQRPTC